MTTNNHTVARSFFPRTAILLQSNARPRRSKLLFPLESLRTVEYPTSLGLPLLAQLALQRHYVNHKMTVTLCLQLTHMLRARALVRRQWNRLLLPVRITTAIRLSMLP
jgi:hypothetical protein